jgi:hypothetical protein
VSHCCGRPGALVGVNGLFVCRLSLSLARSLFFCRCSARVAATAAVVDVFVLCISVSPCPWCGRPGASVGVNSRVSAGGSGRLPVHLSQRASLRSTHFLFGALGDETSDCHTAGLRVDWCLPFAASMVAFSPTTTGAPIRPCLGLAATPATTAASSAWPSTVRLW